MNRKKTSPIWTQLSDKEFVNLIRNSKTYAMALRYFGLSSKGASYKTLKARIEFLGIDDSHIKKGISSNRGRRFPSNRKPLSEILVEHSTYSRTWLKPRLVEEGILEYKCAQCGICDMWMNKPLVLVLDHVNGVSDDNRVENLRFLCPNCNSQTKTFSGRNFNKEHGKKRYYCLCGNEKSKLAKRCIDCYKKMRDNGKICKCGSEKKPRAVLCVNCENKRRVNDVNLRKCKNRPTKEELADMIESMSWCSIGRKYGVSDNAVRKWARKYGLVN